MQEKLHTELKELAVAILNEKLDSIDQLKLKAKQLYEQAIVIEYVEKNRVLEVEKPKAEEVVEVTVERVVNEIKEENTSIIAKELQKDTLEIIEEKPIIEAPELLHELEDLTKDFDLPDFEPLNKVEPITEPVAQPEVVEFKRNENTVVSKSRVSLNDSLNKGFQVGLNDRLAFVNQLFNGNQQDYTRVISQLNTTENLEDAHQFITEIVKPEYNNWEGKEAYEIRFLDLVERNFQD